MRRSHASPAPRFALRLSARLFILGLCAALAGQAVAQGAAAPMPPAGAATGADGDEVKPKFIWGVLIQIAVKYALSAFSSWMFGKLTEQITPASVLAMFERSQTASIVPLRSLVRAGLGAKSAGAPANTVAGEPSAPLSGENGSENYQAVHLSLLAFDRGGHALGFRPVSAGFTTGERFKLRVLPTFDGMLVIENINPQGQRRQIYPPAGDDVVSVKAGIEILVPLARDQFFEFAGATGEERLVVTLRDPRAFGDAASIAVVTRKDDANGSSLMQERVPAGSFPVISQALRIQHDAAR